MGAPDVAAATLLGEDAVYDPVPYFWSEQFGHMVQYAGHHDGARMILRGDPAAEGKAKWAVCWHTEDDTLAAVLAVDRPRDLVQGRRLIEGGQRLDVRPPGRPCGSVARLYGGVTSPGCLWQGLDVVVVVS